MSFDKINFVKPNDILQGGFNPNLPAEITVTEQLLYSIANNLAILNNNLINSGALQNLALIGDLLQEVFTDDRIQDKKTSVFKTAEDAAFEKNLSVFVGTAKRLSNNRVYDRVGLIHTLHINNLNDLDLWTTKNTGCVVNQAASTYEFNVPVPTVNVTSSPATVNVNASAPVVNNNVPVPSVTNEISVQSAVPNIEVNSTAPIVNNNILVPSVTNEVTVQSAVPNIEVNSTAPVVNVASSPATVNVSSTAPIVNNNIPVPSVTNEIEVQSAVPTIEVNSTAPVVNVSSAPVNIDNIEVLPYDDTSLIAKMEEMRVVLEDALMTEVDTDVTKGLTDVIFERDSINFIDYPVDVLEEPSTTKKL